MKTRSYVITLALPLILSGCLKYQYMTVSSTLPLEKDRGYVIRNDGLEICYTFNGIDCPVQIEIKNKSALPLYVDWAKSAIVHDSVSSSYYSNTSRLAASGSSVDFQLSRGVSIGSQSLTGVIMNSAAQEFIAPYAVIRRSLQSVSVPFIDSIQWRKLKLPFNGYLINAKKAEFTRENSPGGFRSYLTIYGEGGKHLMFDTPFWISDVYQARQNLHGLLPKPSVTFNKSRLTGFGTASVVVVTLGAAAAYVVLEHQSEVE